MEKGTGGTGDSNNNNNSSSGRKRNTSKTVKDARVEKTIHPKSRKALQLRRSQLRTDRLREARSSRITTKIFPLLDRFTWFQMVLDPSEGLRTPQQVRELIETYLDRQSNEIRQLRAEQRPGRPLSKRIDELLLIQKTERAEYEGPGFEMPDLTSGTNLEALKKWDGTRESLDLIRITRVRKQ